MRRGEVGARWGSGLLAVVATGALPASACGCRAPTDITLDVTSDLPCSKLEGLEITVGPSGTIRAGEMPSAISRACTERDDGGSFGTLVLAPSRSPDVEITVQAVAGVAPNAASSCTESNGFADCIVVRRQLHYEPHDELTLPIELHRSCLGVSCVGEASTCVDGVCRPSKIEEPSRCVDDACSQAKLYAGDATTGCLGDLDFVGLGTLPGSKNSSFGAVSSDGNVVFAFASSVFADGDPNGLNARAFKCQTPNERTPIVGPSGHPFVPRASDATGSVMIGFEFVAPSRKVGVRWSGGKARAIPSPDESADVFGCDRPTCTVIAGRYDTAPLIWRAPNKQPILLHGMDDAIAVGTAQGVDATGRFAFGTWAGWASTWDLSTNAWHRLGREDENSNVVAATPDGAFLVGYETGGKTNLSRVALWKSVDRWKKYTTTLLDLLPGTDECIGVAVTDDGALITGWCGRVEKSVAVLWDAKSDFAPTRLSDRVAAPPGWKLTTGFVSADGALVAGDATNPHGFLEPYTARLK